MTLRLVSQAFRRNFLKQCRILTTTQQQCFLHDKICVNIVNETYLKKLEGNLFSPSLTVQVVDDTIDHTLILTARPDEFEKLPPKCSACGIVLQTTISNENGYVPEQKFIESVKQKKLDKIKCYKCYRLKYHNETSSIILTKSDVFDQLRHLRQRKALILYVVDMFDIEGTQFQQILQVIGKKKRIIIVGNKVDRFPQDDKKPTQQLEHMKDVLKRSCYDNGLEGCNFRDICLVSAKTGYGLHSLVEKINKHRDVDADVYVIGCANTGKSTLYNAIINLLNVHKSTELPSQAIEHHTPGTTQSLIRQGISMRRLQRLQTRLKDGPWKVEEEFSYEKDLLDLVGFTDEETEKKHQQQRLLENPVKDLQQKRLEFVNFEDMKKAEKPCFIYDTPGIINDSQIIQYLDPNEINYLSPTRWIVPRTFVITPGNCIFIGGLARLDYVDIKRHNLKQPGSDEVVKSAESIYVTMMVSPNIPIHVTVSETADEKYEKLMSNNVLEIPSGGLERLDRFPPLKPQEYIVKGKNLNINACDLVLHGIGWMSIAAVLEASVHVKLHTPNGDGQSLRYQPLLPYSVRKKEGRGVSYRGHINHYMYGHTRKRSPQFIRVFEKQNDPIYSWQKQIKQKMKRERFQVREDRRLQRLEDGVVLGKMKRLLDKEEKSRLADEKNFLLLKEEASKR